jgi:fatty acid desaturase
VAGQAIIRSSWIGNVVFAATAIPAAFGVDAFDPVSAITALALFAVSLWVWVWAFGVAVARSSRGDNIAVGNLFLFEGKVPKGVRAQLFSSVGVCLVITAVTASADPFGVLVPMLPVGLIGLWGARHGVFPPRPGFEPEVRPLRRQRPEPRSRTKRSR